LVAETLRLTAITRPFDCVFADMSAVGFWTPAEHAGSQQPSAPQAGSQPQPGSQQPSAPQAGSQQLSQQPLWHFFA
jgi:hypothetical protein